MTNYEKAFRKTTMNTTVAFAAIMTSSATSLLEDGSLAFTVSSISITIAIFASVAAIAWPAWLAYHDGRIVDDPVQKDELVAAGRSWWQNQWG